MLALLRCYSAKNIWRSSQINDVRLIWSPQCFSRIPTEVSCKLRHLRIWIGATGLCGLDWWETVTSVCFFFCFFCQSHWGRKKWSQWGGVERIRIGRLSVVSCEHSPSAVPPYWRGYDGVRAGAAGQHSGTAEIASSRARSWNATPRLLTLSPSLAFSLSLIRLLSLFFSCSCALSHLLTFLTHPAFLWSEILAFSCSSSLSSSLFPSPPLPPDQHPPHRVPPTPLIHFQ